MNLKNKIIKQELVRWKDLIPFQPENLKKTTPALMQKLKANMRNNGFVSPFFVWQKGKNKYIIDGHHRQRALNELDANSTNVPQELPGIFLKIKDEKEAKKYLLAFNSHYAKIDREEFGIFIEDLDFEEVKTEFEHFTLGFQIPERYDEIEEQEIVKPEIAKTKTGDLYELGHHRVLCGDSTEKQAYVKLMKNEYIDLLFTDPPYAVDYSAKNEFLNNMDKGNSIQKTIENDDKTIEETKEFLIKAFTQVFEQMSSHCSFYICSPQRGDMMMMMIDSMLEGGLNFRHMLIWKKNNHVLGRCDYNYKHEPILYGWKKTHNFYGNGDQRFSVWEYDKPHRNELHPTMKPVPLIINAILNSSEKGNIVSDIFLGSGSTLIACEQTNRKCYGIEIDPLYVDVIVQRWVNLTGISKIKKNGKAIVWK